MWMLRASLSLAGAVLGALAVTGGGRQVEFGDAVKGQQLFAARSCVRCHAVRGAGGRIGPDLGRRASAGSFYELAASMWNHSQGMGRKMAEYRLARPQFQDNELADLISFLYILNYFDEPGDPRLGRVLFQEKHCVSCHGANGEGGEMGPPLDTIPRGTSPLRIASALWNHGPQMLEAIEAANLEPPSFQGKEILDLFAFLRTLGDRSAGPRFQAPGDAGRGAVLFDEKGCSACHALFGVGGDLGPDLGRMELRGSVTQVAGRMWNHWPEMAQSMAASGLEVPVFDENDLPDIFAYIYLTRFAGEDGEAARGQEVYQRKGCGVCHGPAGQGGLGPALAEGMPGLSVGEILQRMWNHAPAMERSMAEQNLPWIRFTAEELADLLTFLGQGW